MFMKKMKFWRRNQHQPQSTKRQSSSSFTASSTEAFRMSFSTDDVNSSTRTLLVGDDASPSPVQNQRLRLDVMDATNNIASPMLTNTESLTEVSHTSPRRQRRTSTSGRRDSSSSSVLSSSCPRSTRQIFEETREEREASLHRGLAILQDMETQAKTSLRKLRGDDDSSFLVASRSSPCGDGPRSSVVKHEDVVSNESSRSRENRRASSIRSCPALPLSPSKADTAAKSRTILREDEIIERMGL